MVKVKSRPPRLFKKNNKRYVILNGKTLKVTSTLTDGELLKAILKILRTKSKRRKGKKGNLKVSSGSWEQVKGTGFGMNPSQILAQSIGLAERLRAIERKAETKSIEPVKREVPAIKQEIGTITTISKNPTDYKIDERYKVSGKELLKLKPDGNYDRDNVYMVTGEQMRRWSKIVETKIAEKDKELKETKEELKAETHKREMGDDDFLKIKKKFTAKGGRANVKSFAKWLKDERGIKASGSFEEMFKTIQALPRKDYFDILDNIDKIKPESKKENKKEKPAEKPAEKKQTLAEEKKEEEEKKEKPSWKDRLKSSLTRSKSQLPSSPPSKIPQEEEKASKISEAPSYYEVPESQVEILDSDQEGDGKRPMRGGLYESEINDIMHQFPEYMGTIPIDKLNTLNPSKTSDSACIINLDPSHKKGSHWIALYISPHRSKSIEYFDSYADDPPESLQRDLRLLVAKINPSTYLKLKVNKIKNQAENSSNCGFFAMKFILDRLSGKKFKDITGYSDVRKGEKDIKEFKKKFKRFGYI